MQNVESKQYLPDINRLGVLSAIVLLTFALTNVIQTPQLTFELQLPGFYIETPLSLRTIMIVLATGLTATGMDWLLRGHPSLRDKAAIEFWLLPTLSTLIIGLPLWVLPGGTTWWIGFLIGGLLLIFIFVAEYIVVDPSAPSYAIATTGLTALSYAVFLILAITLRYGSARLFVLGPVLFIAAGLVSLRVLHLRLSRLWAFAWAGGIALICMQLGASLHYWPISPTQFGLALLGPLYACTTLAGNLLEDIPTSRAIIEPVAALTFAWGIALFIRF
ncbi:MAG: hypothetical protein Kow002_03430 [Anaerolineales bacterium]